jgi:glycosyltransferase involved in cell wall biosynthesis
VPYSATGEDLGRKLRIVHVIGSVDPSMGGPATVVSRLAAAQAAHGHEVTVISALSPSRRKAFRESVASVPGIDRVRFELSDQSASPTDLLKPGFWRRLKSLITQANAVHLHGVWEMVLVAAARIAVKNNVPYVVRPCGMLDPWSLRQKTAKKTLAIKMVYAKMFAQASAFHTTSDIEARNVGGLLAVLGLSVPVEVIPNGIFLHDAEHAPSRESFDRDFPELKGKPFICFLGRLHHKKRPDLMIRGFAAVAEEYPELHLVIAGPDSGEVVRIKRLVAELGLSDRVLIPGAVYDRKKFGLLTHAAGFCLPSEQENFGVAVAEAMACGVPVLVSDQVEIWPEIERAGAGVVFPLQVDALAESLRKVLSNAQASAAMGVAGNRLVRQRFTWPRIANMTLNLYGKMSTRERSARGIREKWEQARKLLVPALRAAGLALTWFVLDITTGR